MMDVSDSLLRDATRIAKASAVAIDIDDPLKSDAFMADVAALRPLAKFLGDFSLVRKWILSGGEDHGLLATLAAADQPKLKGHPQARPIGRILPADGLEPGTVLVAGQHPNLPLGWDHFGN
jgi:thiamine-phosphate kinase